jgi:hypothetical protein
MFGLYADMIREYAPYVIASAALALRVRFAFRRRHQTGAAAGV